MQGGENRFSLDWLDDVNAALDRVQATAGPVALVTTGEGKFYSNGMDLDWLATVPEQAGDYLLAIYRVLGRVLSFPAITVAAVNGHAFGGGAQLAVAHDFAVMRADRGYWCMPEADLGLPLTPEYISLLRAKLPGRALHEALARTAGHSRSTSGCCTAKPSRRCSADRPRRWPAGRQFATRGWPESAYRDGWLASTDSAVKPE